jgi:hypothetical protein
MKRVFAAQISADGDSNKAAHTLSVVLTVTLTILRNEHDTAPNRVLDVANSRLNVVQDKRTSKRRTSACQGLQQFGSARAKQTIDPEDFTPSQCEAQRMQWGLRGFLCV